ncbi:MAG: hypothetical protein LAP13_01935 [Acidobacteriia bacterium]|nr:hypothetical protein [Terriglobia bacterium]
MIRVYFVFEDPLDHEKVNFSFVDVPTRDPEKAFEAVEQAAESGGLWKFLYPDDPEHPQTLIADKMVWLDISSMPHETTADTLLAV